MELGGYRRQLGIRRKHRLSEAKWRRDSRGYGNGELDLSNKQLCEKIEKEHLLQRVKGMRAELDELHGGSHQQIKTPRQPS